MEKCGTLGKARHSTNGKVQLTWKYAPQYKWKSAAHLELCATIQMEKCGTLGNMRYNTNGKVRHTWKYAPRYKWKSAADLEICATVQLEKSDKCATLFHLYCDVLFQVCHTFPFVLWHTFSIAFIAS